MQDTDRGRINVVRDFDSVNHGVHNDTLGAAMESGFGGFAYAMTIVLNLHFLPWGTGAFGCSIRQATVLMRNCFDSRLEIFCRLYERLALEKGFTSTELGGANIREELWNKFIESAYLNEAGQKVGV